MLLLLKLLKNSGNPDRKRKQLVNISNDLKNMTKYTRIHFWNGRYYEVIFIEVLKIKYFLNCIEVIGICVKSSFLKVKIVSIF